MAMTFEELRDFVLAREAEVDARLLLLETGVDALQAIDIEERLIAIEARLTAIETLTAANHRQTNIRLISANAEIDDLLVRIGEAEELEGRIQQSFENKSSYKLSRRLFNRTHTGRPQRYDPPEPPNPPSGGDE